MEGPACATVMVASLDKAELKYGTKTISRHAGFALSEACAQNKMNLCRRQDRVGRRPYQMLIVRSMLPGFPGYEVLILILLGMKLLPLYSGSAT